MKEVVMLDTGPLLAFLGEGLEHHAWVTQQWRALEPPLLTCEAVLAETAFLLKREGLDPDVIFALLDRGVIEIAFQLSEEWADVRPLLRRYRNRPMSLADACLVRLSELHSTCRVFTLDSDFLIYRRHGRQVIPVLMPPR